MMTSEPKLQRTRHMRICCNEHRCARTFAGATSCKQRATAWTKARPRAACTQGMRRTSRLQRLTTAPKQPAAPARTRRHQNHAGKRDCIGCVREKMHTHTHSHTHSLSHARAHQRAACLVVLMEASKVRVSVISVLVGHANLRLPTAVCVVCL